MMLEVAKPDLESVRLTERRVRAVVRIQSLLTGASHGDWRKLPCDIDGLDARGLCIGPGDWLVVSESLTAAELRERWADDPSTTQLAIVDVTYDFVVLELAGGAAREVLAKGCGLDLHPERLPPGQCTRTRLAKIAVLIDCLEQSRFELYASRSYATYLRGWLEDAAVEFASRPSLE
jgi:heterotetrameric sarcosine oxidase gamma subunit